MVRIIDAEGARVSTPDEYRRELDRAAEAAETAAPGQSAGQTAGQAVEQGAGAVDPGAAWASEAPGWPAAGGAAAPSYGEVPPAPGYRAGPSAPGYSGQPYAQPYAVTQGYPVARDAATPDDLTLPLRGATWGQAIKRFFKNYAVFDGRASQSEFLWMELAGLLVYAAFGLAMRALGLGEEPSVQGPDTNPFAVFLIVGILAFALGTFVPHLALTWRRLHDTDLSGAMWCLSFIPYLGSLVVFILCCLAPKPRGARFDAANRYARY